MTLEASPKSSEIIIIGGGVIGASLAYWLTKAGAGVTLVESQSELAGPATASFASAGMLSTAATQTTPPAMVALMRRGLELYPALIEQLHSAQALPTGYTRLKQLRLALNGAEARNLQKRMEWFLEQRLVAEAHWLTPAEVAQVEPLVGQNAGAILHPAAVVRPDLLTKALAEAARCGGADIRTGSPAIALLSNITGSHHESRRVSGVGLANGDRLEADKIVLAAGAWAGRWLDEQLARIEGLVGWPPEVPPPPHFREMIWPVRGQLLALQMPKSIGPLRHLLSGAHGYAIPRPDGSVVYGATVEPEAGFEAHMTAAGYLELGRLVHKLTPALDNAPVRDSWAGLRPGSRSELPVLGPLPGLAGLWLAMGHFRSGVMLAPASAELLTRAILDDDPALLTDFAIG